MSSSSTINLNRLPRQSYSLPPRKQGGPGWGLFSPQNWGAGGALLLLIVTITAAHAQSPQNGTGVTSFRKDVLPILRTACVGCHSGAHPAAALALTSYAEMMHGGNGGVPLVAGKSAESKMVKMLLGTLQPQMPPGGGLKKSDIDGIRKWIDAGALPDKEDPGKARKEATPAAAPHAVKRLFPTAATTAVVRRSVPTPVTALAFSPDGKTLAVGTYQEVQFWDVATRQRLGTWSGHPGSVHALAFNRDGRLLAAGSGVPASSGQVRLWEMTTGREIRAIAAHDDVVNTVAFRPDGLYLATGSADKTIKIWETATGKLIQTLRDHADAVWCVAFSPDGKNLASVSTDRSMKIWEPIGGKRLYSVDAHDDIAYDVEFSADGKNLLTSGGDKLARLWAFGAESSTLVRGFGGHDHAVLAATYAPDGKTMATASADRTVRLWNIADGGNRKTFTDAKDWVYSVRFSPDGQHLAAGVWDGSLLLWSVKDGKLEATLSTVPGEPKRP